MAPHGGGGGGGGGVDGHSAVTGYFFSDTQGSLWMVEPNVSMHELLPRSPTANVENSILSLAYDAVASKLYFTVNTTIMVLQLSKDGTTALAPPTTVADFAPRGVQSLVVEWPTATQTRATGAAATAYFCLFNNATTSAGGSLVVAPLADPARYTLLVNSTLAVLSGLPFGDALPRLAVDSAARRVYYTQFALGIYSVDIDTPKAPTRVPFNGLGSPLLSLALIPSPKGASDPPFLAFSSLTGYIAAVAVSGGDVKWLSSPCFPTGGCSYHQLWDMKTLPVPPTGSPRPHPGNATRDGAALQALLVAPWLQVTNLDERVATVLSASVRTLTFTPGPDTDGNNYTAVASTALCETWHQGNVGVRTPSSSATPYMHPPRLPRRVSMDPQCSPLQCIARTLLNIIALLFDARVLPACVAVALQITVRPDTCTAFYTKTQYSSIVSSLMNPLEPVSTEYSYHNFRFVPTFAIDAARDRAW
jgi:hypothetical protein